LRADFLQLQMSCATSYDSVTEKHTFPNVVGCEEFRAKAMIRYWIKVKTGIESVSFRMYNHLDKNKLTRPSKDGFGKFGLPEVAQHANEIILWYDYKYDAVAITPYWFGSVHYEKERSEAGFEGHEENEVYVETPNGHYKYYKYK